MLKVLAELRLDQVRQGTFKGLCDRLSKAATKRNRIVHGSWVMEVVVRDGEPGGPPAMTSTWVRVNQPISPAAASAVHDPGNQNTRDAHRFTPACIGQAAGNLETLLRDFAAFTRSAAETPPPRGGK